MKITNAVAVKHRPKLLLPRYGVNINDKFV